MLELYREKYFDFNVQHFVEKLQSEHDIHLSYSWVKKALQEAGLVAKKHKRGRHRKRRLRRSLMGMLLHADASKPCLVAGAGPTGPDGGSSMMPTQKFTAPSWWKKRALPPGWRL